MDIEIAESGLEVLDKLNESGYHNTVTMMRGVFLPYKKPSNTKLYRDFIENNRSLDFENSHIKLTISGYLLTQIHANILDIIMTKLNPMVSQNGRIYVECSLYKLQKYLGLKRRNDTQAIKKFLSQMRDTTIWLYKKANNMSHAFHIIEKFYKDESTNRFIIVLSPDFINLFFMDVLVNYKPFVDTILAFKYSTNQSIARYIISNTHITISLMKLLEMIGINTATISVKEKTRIKNNITNEKHLFEKLGITISENMTFKYLTNKNKKPGVYFLNQLNT